MGRSLEEVRALGIDGRYLLYVHDCAGWGVTALPFEQFKSYWEVFAKDGELDSAPILVQRPAFGGHYQQASGQRL